MFVLVLIVLGAVGFVGGNWRYERDHARSVEDQRQRLSRCRAGNHPACKRLLSHLVGDDIELGEDAVSVDELGITAIELRKLAR